MIQTCDDAHFFRNAAIGEEEALKELANPYGKAAAEMIRFWRLTSEGMELFPWETTWFIREIGRSRVDHSLSAATLRGMSLSHAHLAVFAACHFHAN